MDYDKIKFIKERIRSKIIPQPRTIKEILKTKEVSSSIKTRLPILDLYLRGGIQPYHITEIVGAPGVGKTQFCQMLTVLSIIPSFENHLNCNNNSNNYEDDSLNESSVIYFDTEQSSSASRLKEIAQSIFPDFCSKEENVIKFMNRVFIIHVTSSNDLLSHLKELEEKIILNNVKLIIVDSIASIVRKEFDSSTLHKRQHLLNDEASLLKYYAESFHIPVVVTNQVNSLPSQKIEENDHSLFKIRYATAALGTVWSHCVNTRLVLEYYHPNEVIEEAKDRKLFRMIIAKSPVSPVISFPYYIDSNGLNLIKKSNNHQVNINEIDDYYMEIDSSNYWDQMIMCNSTDNNILFDQP